VQSNLGVMNELYMQFSEFSKVGKTLYKGVDAEKVSEYTFSYLLKKVRIVHHQKNTAEEA
jgi:hypothetical protein